MERDRDQNVQVDEAELDRKAWNLPVAVKRPQTHQAPFSVQSRREDKTEVESTPPPG